MKVYGPYLRKDGRKHVIEVEENGKRRTVSYPKWLMEQKLGRRLDPDIETVDHIDEDFTNDSYDNLQIMTRLDNARKSRKPPETYTFICPECGIQATKFMRDVRGNWKQGRQGPFCSRKCAGKANQREG